MKRTNKNYRKCRWCGKQFTIYRSQIKKGGGIYCSRICQARGYSKKKKAFCLTCGQEFQYSPTKKAGLFCSRFCYETNKEFLHKQTQKAAMVLVNKKGSQSHPKATDEELLKSWGRVKGNKGLSLREEFGKYGYRRVPPKKLIKLIGVEEYKRYVEECGNDKVRSRFFGKRKKQRGYESELRARKELLADGHYVMRSSASLTAFDLIAINKEQVRLIQVKRCKNELPSYSTDIQEMQKVEVPQCCAKEIWIWRDKRGWIKKII